MKTISTFVTLSYIIITCAASVVLYLNQNYKISAALCFIWIISLTIWIGKSTRKPAFLMHAKRRQEKE